MASKFQIKGNHFEITTSLEAHIISKLAKVEKVMDRITSINIILNVDNRDQTAEAELRISGDQHSIFAEATSDDMYKSIDELEHKLLKQVIKYNEILKSHKG